MLVANQTLTEMNTFEMPLAFWHTKALVLGKRKHWLYVVVKIMRKLSGLTLIAPI